MEPLHFFMKMETNFNHRKDALFPFVEVVSFGNFCCMLVCECVREREGGRKRVAIKGGAVPHKWVEEFAEFFCAMKGKISHTLEKHLYRRNFSVSNGYHVVVPIAYIGRSKYF